MEIDYNLKKNLRKPNGSKPGFVVYYTNYSMMAEPNIRNLQEVLNFTKKRLFAKRNR